MPLKIKQKVENRVVKVKEEKAQTRQRVKSRRKRLVARKTATTKAAHLLTLLLANLQVVLQSLLLMEPIQL